MKNLLRASLPLLLLTAGCKKDSKQSLPILSTSPAVNITANTVQTGGIIIRDGGSAISQKGICWATHSQPIMDDSLTTDGADAGKFTCTLRDLASYTTYYVRAYAINASGTAYGNELSFTTSTGLPAINTTVISKIAPLTAQSGGYIISDGGTPVTVRGVCWSSLGHPTVNNNRTIDSSGKGAFTSTLAPIGSKLTYYVRAYATNAFGTSYGNEISFTSASADAVTDIDANVYPYIQIGTQTWMVSNLKTKRYRNADTIADGFGNNSAYYRSWYSNPPGTGAYTYPGNDSTNNTIYGKYYDALSMIDSRGICPVGWHVPTDDEWNTLEIFEGLSQADAENEGSYVGSIGSKLLVGGSSGLNLQLGGYLYLDPDQGPVYQSIGNGMWGLYWSSSQFVSTYWFRAFDPPGIPGAIYRAHTFNYAMPIRCLKD